MSELFHYGVKGMKWGVRRTPEELGHKTTKRLTSEEKKSLRSYTSDFYKEVNGILRGNKTQKNMSKEDFDYTNYVIKQCTSALSKTSTKNDMKTLRAMSESGLSKFLNIDESVLTNKDSIKSLIGLTTVDRGFFSTTTNNKTLKKYGSIILQVSIPKGSQGMDISPYSYSSKESEFILQRNTTFKVSDVHIDNNGKIIGVSVDVIDQLGGRKK